MPTKLYKADKRNKYPGTGIHLEADDCNEILKWHADFKANKQSQLVQEQAIDLCKRLAKSVKAVLAEHPDMLQERTPEQVKAALEKDAAKIAKQLKAGKNWKEVE